MADIQLRYVNTNLLNARRGAGLKYPIAQRLPDGLDITVIADNVIAADGWHWVERAKYRGLWVASELLSDAAPVIHSKVFGVHWSENDNGEMLDILSHNAAAGHPVPWILILGGVNDVSLAEIRKRSPWTKIFHRQFYPWGGSSVQNYSPPNGWGRATYAEGRDHAKWYKNLLGANQSAFIRKGQNVWHVGFNEPGLGGDDAGDHFIDWHNGYLDEMTASDLWITAFNFPPGYPDYPGGIHEGNRFWSNPRAHSFINKLYGLGGFVNLHEGDIFHARNFRGEDDSLRHRKIRKALPINLRNIPIACTEYYLYDIAAMDPLTMAHQLGEGQALLAGDNVMPMLWVYKATPGFEGDDFYNKAAVYGSYLGA